MEQHLPTSDPEALAGRLEALERRCDREKRTTQVGLIVAAFSALSLPAAVFALGPVPNAFSSGEIVSAAAMNDNFTHLENGITAVEGLLPPNTCAVGEIARFDGTSWVCDVDQTLQEGDTNVLVNNGMISFADNLEASSIAVQAVDMPPTIGWNNSVSNRTPEMSYFSWSATCNETLRGRVRVIWQEDIGNSTDIGDALCFCQRYVDRTPEPDVTTYRWACVYPNSDGN